MVAKQHFFGLLASLLLLTLNVQAAIAETTLNDGYHKSFSFHHSQGWHWYKDSIKEKKRKIPQLQPEKSLSSSDNPSLNTSINEESKRDPIAELDAVKLSVKRALAKALINPTPESVKDYIQKQRLMTNQAARFTSVWQQVLLENPNLDFTLKHPTGQLAKQAMVDSQQKNDDQAIADFAKTNGLFFFFKSTCPYCHRFAPILKSFAAQYHIKLIPVSLDGKGLPEFPNPHKNAGQAERLKVSVVPAVFAVSPSTRKITAIGYGLMSMTELHNRLMKFISKTKTKSTEEENNQSVDENNSTNKTENNAMNNNTAFNQLVRQARLMRGKQS